jgi:hypothetical protein
VPKPWYHDGETIDPAATGATGNTVAAEIEAARLSAQIYRELNLLVQRLVPSEQWPEHVRAVAGELIACYSEEALAADNVLRRQIGPRHTR